MQTQSAKKTKSLTLRVSADFKRLLAAKAAAQNRSIASYIETLVLQDIAPAVRRERDANLP